MTSTACSHNKVLIFLPLPSLIHFSSFLNVFKNWTCCSRCGYFCSGRYENYLFELTGEHLPAINASGLYDVKAVYSRSRKSAEALIPGGGVDIYSDDSGSGKSLDDLLARKDIQAVDIVLPITHQPSVIKRALKAGKHVVQPIH